MLTPNFLIVFATFLSIVYADQFDEEWTNYQVQFQRQYSNSKEVQYRKQIFKRNLENIRKHNKEYEAGLHSYKKGLNQFTDLTDEEKQNLNFGLHPHVTEWMNSKQHGFVDSNFFNTSGQQIPDSIDHRKLGAVTPVKTQGKCASSWAFSATGSLEGQYFLATKKLVSFSEQELLDCSSVKGGCHGGNVLLAFADVQLLGGIASEKDYPYKAKKSRCTFTPKMAMANVSDVNFIQRNDEDALKEAVALAGPISVAIRVTKHFVEYKEGIFYDETCKNFDLPNRGVLVVGYGTDKKSGHDYWIVKNSWSPKWGEEGYIKMSRNRNNNCFIAMAALYPSVQPLKD